jgi:hypothetical protein
VEEVQVVLVAVEVFGAMEIKVREEITEVEAATFQIQDVIM